MKSITVEIDSNTIRISWTLRLFAGIFLLGALGEWPYGYYQLLRWVVTVAALLAIWVFLEKKQNILWILFFTGAVILFNPLAPINMLKENWAAFDLIFGLTFLGSLATLNMETK